MPGTPSGKQRLGFCREKLRLRSAGSPMQNKPSIIQCNCGVSYERSEQQLPIKDIGVFDCEMCGERLEMWSGRNVPLFKRIKGEASQRRHA